MSKQAATFLFFLFMSIAPDAESKTGKGLLAIVRSGGVLASLYLLLNWKEK